MTTQPDLFDICANRHGGNAMSTTARGRTNAETDRLKVLAAIKSRGAQGATCDEIEVELGMSHQSCSARISELKARAKVRIVGTRKTRTGCKAAVLATI